jgi:hypothetical protein
MSAVGRGLSSLQIDQIKIAAISGVRAEAVKRDLKIAYGRPVARLQP